LGGPVNFQIYWHMGSEYKTSMSTSGTYLLSVHFYCTHSFYGWEVTQITVPVHSVHITHCRGYSA